MSRPLSILDAPTPSGISVKSSIHTYKDSGYKWINYALRMGDRPRMHEQGRAEFDAHIENLMSLMQPAAAAERTMLYRGCAMPKRILLSRSWSDRAFISTSRLVRTAQRFTSQSVSDSRRGLISVVLHIQASAGTPMAALDEAYRNFYTGHEQELLLPPGVKMRLGLRYRRKGVWHIHATVSA